MKSLKKKLENTFIGENKIHKNYEKMKLRTKMQNSGNFFCGEDRVINSASTTFCSLCTITESNILGSS